VEAVLEQRRRQIGELKIRVSSAEDRAASLRERADLADDERRRLDQELTNMKDQHQHMYLYYLHIYLHLDFISF